MRGLEGGVGDEVGAREVGRAVDGGAWVAVDVGERVAGGPQCDVGEDIYAGCRQVKVAGRVYEPGDVGRSDVRVGAHRLVQGASAHDDTRACDRVSIAPNDDGVADVDSRAHAANGVDGGFIIAGHRGEEHADVRVHDVDAERTGKSGTVPPDEAAPQGELRSVLGHDATPGVLDDAALVDPGEGAVDVQAEAHRVAHEAQALHIEDGSSAADRQAGVACGSLDDGRFAGGRQECEGLAVGDA